MAWAASRGYGHNHTTVLCMRKVKMTEVIAALREEDPQLIGSLGQSFVVGSWHSKGTPTGWC